MDHNALRFLRDLLENELQRAFVIEALAPELPPAAIQYAVDAALHLLERDHDAAAALRGIGERALELDDPLLLVGPGEALIDHIHEDDLVAFARLVVAVPDTFRQPRSRMLAALAVRLARAGRTDSALFLLEVVGGDIVWDDWLGSPTAEIARALDDTADAERLLALASALEPEARAPALVELAPHLSHDAAEQLVETAEAIDDAPTRFRLYAAVVGTLAPEARPERAARLLSVTADMPPSIRSIVAVALAEALEPPEREAAFNLGVDAAIDELHRRAADASWAPDPWFWAAVLGALDRAEPERRRDVARAVFEAAHGLSTDWRAEAFSALATRLSPDERVPFAGVAWAAVGPSPTLREERSLQRLFPGTRVHAGIALLPTEAIRSFVESVPIEDLDDVIMAALVPVGADVADSSPERVETEPEVEDWDDEIDFDDDLDVDDVDAVYEIEPLPDDHKADVDAPARPTGGKPALRRPAVVNTGFADPADPRRGIDPFRPLHPGDWYFWLDVGEPRRESIERQLIGLLPSVESGCTVTVAIYPVSDGVEILDGRDTGDLEVQPDGSAIVNRAAAPLESYPELAVRRLIFPIRIAPGTSAIELRCSIFRRQLLVQSRRIRALVADRPSPPGAHRVLTSDLDYVLVRRLSPRELRPIAEHRVSLMLNGDGTTHNLHALVAGEDRPVTHSTRFDGGEIQDMIVQARRAFRAAAFGSPEPWHERDRYRYDGPLDRERLGEDLLVLAVRGYRFYDACINRLIGSYEASVAFAERTLRTASIQIALKQHGNLLLPAALFYDHPLDTGLPNLRLCPEFVAAVGDVDALLRSACFDGGCPSHGDPTVVCPSGFWGYRHNLGLPLSLDERGAAPFEIEYDTQPHLGVAVSMDPQFKLRAEHEKQLQALRPDLGWRYAATRADVIELMRMREGPEVLYFYCHGGVSEANAPFLGVGGVDEPGITSDALRTYGIRWRNPQPLVFINGCHTTALEPDTALDFVSRLVDTASAAGVIGTEITTFEPLAGAFATECLRRFLGGEEIGTAVRGARLALLAQGNPLGLIYVPFVMPNVKLVERRAIVAE